MKMLDTIKYPDTFKKSPSAQFDGVFDWSWTQGCFGAGKITPMDFDGVVERKGNFIIIETKNMGVPVPLGQMITLESIYKLDVFTVIFIQGKSTPELAKVWCQPGFKGGKKMDEYKETDVKRMQGFLSEWYEYVNK